jgi:hypothetical protein
MTTYEVRVEGELAHSTLQSLHCAHALADQQTSMRIEATPSELHRVLQICSDSGMTIERVVRIDA